MIRKQTLTQYLYRGQMLKYVTRIERTGFLSSIFKTKKHVEYVEIVTTREENARIIVQIARENGDRENYSYPRETVIFYYMKGIERIS